MEEENFSPILQNIVRWCISEALVKEGKKPTVIFQEMSYFQMPFEYLNFKKLKLDTKEHLAFKFKFYFRYSFSENNFQPYDPTIRSYIIGEIVFGKAQLNILGLEYEIKNCPWHLNFIGMRYSPSDKNRLNGNPLINNYILNQRKFEKKFKLHFK